ncbi:MAG: 5'-3' exonuclease [Mycoplasmoidaceae bacterium]
MKSKALIIDGNSLMFRAFYATFKQLTYYKEHNLPPRNALKTTAQMIFNIIKKEEYEYYVIAFDPKGGNFRNELSQDYKSNRKSTPVELVEQITLIHKFCSLIGFNVFCIPGYEADDIVGSAAKLLADHDIICEIFSSDHDLLQLVDVNTNVSMILNGGEFKRFDINNFSDQYYGLKPCQIIDYKAIAGDKSDNIIGIKGIGQKGAINLLNEFKSIEGVYGNIELIRLNSTKEKLLKYKEQAFESKKIIAIVKDYFDNFDFKKFKKKDFEYELLMDFFEENQIKSLERYLP